MLDFKGFDREDVLFLLTGLVAYRRILKDEVISAFAEALEKGSRDKLLDFTSLLIEKSHNLGLSGVDSTLDNIFRQYLIYKFLLDENVFSLACENRQNIENTVLYEYAKNDVVILQGLCGIDYGDGITSNLSDSNSTASNSTASDTGTIAHGQTSPIKQIIQDFENSQKAEEKIKLLISYYQNHGAGDMGRFSMFIFDTEMFDMGLMGVKNPDPVAFEDIIGLKHQKTSLIENTEAFLSGKPANNVLLVGSRGSGKSSCIKALVNRYHDRGLRLVEVQKDQITYLPALVENLAARGKYFIIYMDDLSFEQSETQYKYLKSLLEGSAGGKPDNVIFYATSNRRHIIWEIRTDRETRVGDADGELHISDTINETMSLSDRFGLTLYFLHIDQKEYLEIVMALAARRGIEMEPKILRAKALQWTVEHKRMSGRTAVQFLNQLV